jgi:hypothetical protein
VIGGRGKRSRLMAMNADDTAIRLLCFSYHAYLESGNTVGETGILPSCRTRVHNDPSH